MSDYKYGIQLLADEYAWEMFNKSFDDCTDTEQEEAYKAAEDLYWDKQASKAALSLMSLRL